ncbi:MAG TPA: hypothetical protein VFN67_34700 [Polyangiales bacterium]|nr:hypothetical protein [Polyangiales bacterium]
MPITAQSIAELTRDEVDQLFRRGEVGQIPDGDAVGTAIFFPSNPLEPLIERFVQRIAWRGKVVSSQRHDLKNKITPLGIRAIAADVYTGRSWFDGADCIVLDYSKRSFFAKLVRDEIRRVAPGLYLGVVYLGHRRTIHFTLQFTV